MKREKCEATANIENYLNWENITIIRNRQYAYYSAPLDLIKRNYVCVQSKRTYSLDFMYEQYENRQSLLEDIYDLKEDIKLMNDEFTKKK